MASPQAENIAVKGKSALICGSVAFDTIMVFSDRFKNHILPEKIHMLNVSFLVPQLRRERGGCAGNIAYGLKLLGDRGYAMATVGHDFGPYHEWMVKNGVPTDHIKVIDTEHTAQAFITTDLDDNQITAFHPGAMQSSHLNSVTDARDVGIGIVAPDGRDGMIQHAEQFARAGIPFIFDPGQGLPMFGREELDKFVGAASWVAVNDYEWQMLQQKTGWDVRDVTARVKALIVTRGANGSVIYTRDGEIEVPSARPHAVVDPTGCGDAYRAGLLHGLLHGLDWQATGRIASLMGAIKIETRGPQNHRFTREEFDRRLAENFGAAATKRSGS
ncbi:MAG TPA: carbohydrate kinase family protein [Steroidobacteraceae bacterium]|jgi:adenosine kinase|nr:carbohydrate kinase family protein [Steroidobacteraceae bacterium]